ncbi:hypothetical protein Tco_0134175 [Tanacetum coccineum]
MKYKAEKVYHEEMVKMPLVDLKVLEREVRISYRVSTRERHRMRKGPCCLALYGRMERGGARVEFEDEFRAVEEREVSSEAQQGRSRVKRKIFGSYRNDMGNDPILALPEGSDNFIVIRGARVRILA